MILLNFVDFRTLSNFVILLSFVILDKIATKVEISL